MWPFAGEEKFLVRRFAEQETLTMAIRVVPSHSFDVADEASLKEAYHGTFEG